MTTLLFENGNISDDYEKEVNNPVLQNGIKIYVEDEIINTLESKTAGIDPNYLEKEYKDIFLKYFENFKKDIKSY